jgi:hypothetical protein
MDGVTPHKHERLKIEIEEASWSSTSISMNSMSMSMRTNLIFLRLFHGDKSVFPTKTQLRLVKNKHAPTLHFDKYTYEKLLNEKSTKTEKVTVEYRWADH